VTDKLRAVGIVLTFCLLLEGGWIGSGCLVDVMIWDDSSACFPAVG